MAPSETSQKLDVLRDDCRKLFSAICHQEVICNRKRRWLMGSTSDKDDQKKLNASKFLQEALIRSDDVSFVSIKRPLESNFTSLTDTQQSNHIVADYLELFDSCMIEKPAIFLESLSSALGNLRSNVLEHVAHAVTGDNNMSWTTRGAIKRVVLEILPKMFLQSKHEEHFRIIKQLSQIFRNPINFRNQTTIITPVTASLLSSIENTMQNLDCMPTQALVAMDRKFDGVKVVPQLPIFITCKRGPLINRLMMKYNEIFSTLKDGDELPKSLAKALSIMSLTLKEKGKQLGTPATEFFPFTPEIEALQNDILMAIWSVPKVKIDELKRLRELMDPDGNLPSKTFRSALVKFLMEYLFECDEIDVPKSFSKVVSFINRKSRRQLDFVKTIVSDDEVEPMMNVSSQLKQILWDSFLDNADQTVLDACIESLESDDGDDVGDDIIINEDKKCSGFAAEGTGDSEFADRDAVATVHVKNRTATNGDRPGSGCDMGLKDSQSCQSESGSQASLVYGSYHSIQSLCDDTSFLAHKLIDRVLERLPRTGPEASGISDGIGARLLIQAVEELVPSFPQGGIDRAKNLMGIY